MVGYFQQINDDYFPDRILEAEKICDKHEMEQFPNEGDDLQVLIVDNGKQLSWMIFLEIILKFSNHRQSSNLLLHGSWPPWSSGRSTFLTSKSFRLKTRWTMMVLMMNLYNNHDAGRGYYILMLRELGNQNIMIF